jgi:hypothetical protein
MGSTTRWMRVETYVTRYIYSQNASETCSGIVQRDDDALIPARCPKRPIVPRPRSSIPGVLVDVASKASVVFDRRRHRRGGTRKKGGPGLTCGE